MYFKNFFSYLSNLFSQAENFFFSYDCLLPSNIFPKNYNFLEKYI